MNCQFPANFTLSIEGEWWTDRLLQDNFHTDFKTEIDNFKKKFILKCYFLLVDTKLYHLINHHEPQMN